MITRAHPDLEAFDLAWLAGRGGLLAQLAGESVEARGQAVVATMRACGLEGVSVRSDDAGLWARQRAGQRSAERALVQVRHRPDALDRILILADEADATVVGRAALGVAYLTLGVPEIARVRAGLPPEARRSRSTCRPRHAEPIDPWAVADGPGLELMRELKGRYDPAGVCNPGIFVGSI